MRIGRSTASAFLIVGIIAALCTDAADAVTGVPSAAASGTSGTTRTTTATTGSGSQHDALAAAAHGSYTGKYGTLDFREDGTATFHILNCGYFDRSPGRVKIDTSCKSDPSTAFDQATGPLTVGEYSYAVYDQSRTNVLGAPIPDAEFDAYVDDGGMLHVFYGDVAYLGPSRRATAHFAYSDLEVGKGTCRQRVTSTGQSVTAPCKFVHSDGREMLLYRGFDPFHQDKVTNLGLVYLPKTGLLVEAPLADYAFKKTTR